MATVKTPKANNYLTPQPFSTVATGKSIQAPGNFNISKIDTPALNGYSPNETSGEVKTPKKNSYIPNSK